MDIVLQISNLMKRLKKEKEKYLDYRTIRELEFLNAFLIFLCKDEISKP